MIWTVQRRIEFTEGLEKYNSQITALLKRCRNEHLATIAVAALKEWDAFGMKLIAFETSGCDPRSSKLLRPASRLRNTFPDDVYILSKGSLLAFYYRDLLQTKSIAVLFYREKGPKDQLRMNPQQA
jgi:hypothetical protein